MPATRLRPGATSVSNSNHLPPVAARFSLGILARQYAVVRAEIVAIEKRIHAWHRSSEESRRLEEIPGVGLIVATALVAEI
jgi:transposase